MTDTMKVIIGVLLPFLGTSLGAASVFFMKGEMNPKLQKALLGFASGVMVAASVWSLIMPGIEMAEAAGKIAWLPAAAGFLGGMFFLLILDSLIPHLHLNSDKPEGRHTTLGKSFMLVFAVALHNLPEGMAVGVVLAAMLSGESVITAAGAFALDVGAIVLNGQLFADHGIPYSCVNAGGGGEQDVLEIKDLKPGMELTGVVRNVIDFGAFVDIGVHQDGLVHISQLSNKYIKHPSEAVSVGDQVTVWVLEVNVQKKRISLTMKKPKNV